MEDSIRHVIFVLSIVALLACPAAVQSDSVPDTVIIVSALKDSKAVFRFSTKDPVNNKTVTANVTVGPQSAATLDLAPTSPENASLLLQWSFQILVDSMSMSGEEFTLRSDSSRLIRVSKTSGMPDLIRISANQTVTLLNGKFDPKVDHAVILAVNDADNTSRSSLGFYINATSDNCYDCKMWALEGDHGELRHNYGMYLRADTNFDMLFDVYLPNNSRSSRKEKRFLDKILPYRCQEKAEYLLMCHDHSSLSSIDCTLYQTKSGVDTFAPLWHAALAIGVLSVVIATSLYLNRRYQLWLRVQCRTHDRLVNADLGDADDLNFSGKYSPTVAANDSDAAASTEATRRQTSVISSDAPIPPRGKKQTKRLRSLDTFRGISLSIMIFVNYEGGRYWFFNHSRWNGLTVADCVFPWFIWIMGTSMVISLNSQRRKGFSKLSMAIKVIRRSIILFCIGLFLNNGFDLSHWRIPGVLQRFGVSYLVVGLVDIFVPRLNVSKNSSVYDVLAFTPHWIIMITLIIVHTAVTFGMAVPGCPTGYLGPGGIGDQNRYPNCTAGAAGYIDKMLFGQDHFYHHPTCTDTYHCDPYDPEGVLGSLTSIFLCFLGMQAGRILAQYDQNVPRIARWIIWACILGGIGTGLCGASQNGGVIPMNKNLWSLSFILILGSGAFILLSLCYFLVDVLNVWSGAPFYFPGMNSILVYVGSEVLQGYFPFSFKVDSGHSGILASSLIGVTVWLVVAFYLHHIKFYLKI